MVSLVVNGAPQTNGVAHGPHSRNPSSYAARFHLPDHFIGGNHLDAAPAGVVKDFVQDNDGHTVITNVNPPTDELRAKTKLTAVSRYSSQTMELLR